VTGTAGGTGGLARRGKARVGEPLRDGEFRSAFDSGDCLVAVDGVSADAAVRLLSEGRVVAEAPVAAHGPSFSRPWFRGTRRSRSSPPRQSAGS
jgi:hypothetical protein